MATTKSEKTVVITLTEDEAQKLAGLLMSVPTKDEFFGTLAWQIDGEYPVESPTYSADEDGDYVREE